MSLLPINVGLAAEKWRVQNKENKIGKEKEIVQTVSSSTSTEPCRGWPASDTS